MHIEELYKQLCLAYSIENLNRISSDIIQLYRDKDVPGLRRVHSLIYDGDQAAELPLPRIFSRIIMVYHPDRQENTIKEIEEQFTRKDFEGLQSLSHILEVQRLDLSPSEDVLAGDFGFDNDNIWDDSVGGFSFIDDETLQTDDYDIMGDMGMNRGFFNAVKRRLYGHLNVDFPVHLLADMEIIEMAEYEIEHLEGVEYCVYARIVDLSGNNLTEVSRLGMLMHLEEVYIQNNQVSYLDGLNELPYLRVLDISYNEIDDISALFEIDSLEFVNAIGNRIPDWQLEKLTGQGVIVIA